MLHLTANNFQIELNHASTPVIVMFYASWCGKCAMMKPVAEDLEAVYRGRMTFAEVNVDESPALASAYSATVIPTFVFFRKGKAAEILHGWMNPSTLERKIQKFFINS